MKVTYSNLVKRLGCTEEVARQIVQQIKDSVSASTTFDAIDKLLGTNGVTNVSGENSGLLYCNTGDVYDTTVCFDGTWFIGSCGDWCEQNTEDTTDEYAHFG